MVERHQRNLTDLLGNAKRKLDCSTRHILVRCRIGLNRVSARHPLPVLPSKFERALQVWCSTAIRRDLRIELRPGRSNIHEYRLHHRSDLQHYHRWSRELAIDMGRRARRCLAFCWVDIEGVG